MMSLRTIAALGLAVATAAAAPTAWAADILQPPPLPVSHPVVDVGGGFYLRGDVGVGILQTGDYHQPELIRGGGTFLRRDIDDTFFAGVGAGYQFNNWFRADVTAEYRGAVNFSGADQYSFTCPFQAGSCGAVGQVITRNNLWNGSLSSVVLMANAYVDLGTWHGITPYIGAGVGGAYNRIFGVTDFDPSDLGGGGIASANSDWNVAWALHAGLSYDVTSNFKVELGYRYLNLGEAKSGRLRCLGNFGCDLGPLTVKDIDSHDIKLGMRWLLAEKAYVSPPPLIRKY